MPRHALDQRYGSFDEEVSENVGDAWYLSPRREDYPSAT